MNSVRQSLRNCGGGKLLLLLLEVVPEVQEAGEVRVLVPEARMLLRGELLLVRWALARVLDGQGRGEDHDFPDAAALAGLHDHPAEPRVHGQLGKLLPDGGQPAAVPAAAAPAGRPPRGRASAGSAVGRLFLRARRSQGAELPEERDAVVDGAGVRRLHEREVLHVLGAAGHAHGRHLQDDGGEVGAQDLGIRELRPGLVVLFRIQPDGDAVGDTAAAAGALVGRGLGDTLDGQPLHLGPVRVPRNARRARVDDVLDAGHGEGGFRDVGGQHNPAIAAGVEDLVLLLQAQPGKERQHLGAGQPPVGLDPGVEGLGGVADFALAGEEDEDVARRFEGQFVDGVADGVERVAVLLEFVVGGVVFIVAGAAAPPAGWESGR